MLCHFRIYSQKRFAQTKRRANRLTPAPGVCLGSGGWLSSVLFYSSVEKYDYKNFASFGMTRIGAEIK